MTCCHMLCIYINTLWFYVSGIIEYTEIVFIFLTARNNNKCALGLQCLVMGLSWAGNQHAWAMSPAWSRYTNSTTYPSLRLHNNCIADIRYVFLRVIHRIHLFGNPDWYIKCRGGHRHLQIGRLLDFDLISESPHAPSYQMSVSKVWESVWPEGQEAPHS